MVTELLTNGLSESGRSTTASTGRRFDSSALLGRFEPRGVRRSLLKGRG